MQTQTKQATNIIRRLYSDGWTREETVSSLGVTFHYLTRFDGSGTAQRAIVREVNATGAGRLFFEST